MINTETILLKAEKLIIAHKEGLLGGEVMPEDNNIGYKRDSKENYLYFTLPMALNYQRNSYTLWESVKKAAQDKETCDVFSPEQVVVMDENELRYKLVKHKVALQQNKQTDIWLRLSKTFFDKFDGDVRNLFIENDNDIAKIKKFMLSHKKDFPYLSGNKIMNYWLYVMLQYTDAKLIGRNFITVAPDTHVIQASQKLELISETEASSSSVQELVASRWEEVFDNTDYDVIDIHTPLWLWSRCGYKKVF